MDIHATAITNLTSNTTLLFQSTSGHVISTSQLNHVSSTSGIVANFSITSDNSSSFNTSSTPATQIPGEEEGLPGGVVVLLVLVVMVVVTLLFLLVYCTVKGKVHRHLPWKVKVTKRRSSTSSSRHPLDVDDPEDEGRREDDLPVAREVAMFTIDDFEPVNDDEYSRRTNNEEYFYDEVFGQSMFEDEVTNASMRHLYLEEDDMFDLETTVASLAHPRSRDTSTTSSSSGRRL